MARLVPPATDPASRIYPPAPAAPGGGGNTWKEWTDLPLDPTDGWTVLRGTQAVANGSDVAKVGSALHFTSPTATRLKVQGNLMEGVQMTRSLHISPYADAGVPVPAGTADHLFQPEVMIFKLEVQFDTDDTGPISGGNVVGSTGHNLMCIAGLSGYMTDQSGSPVITGNLWLGAMVEKNLGGDPATSTSVNMYKSGYRTYFTNAGTAAGYTWKNMSSPPAGAHDSIVFSTPPLRKEPSTNGRNEIFAGSYASDQPFFPMCLTGLTIFDNATKLSWTAAQTFWHITLWFGTRSATYGSGQVRIKKIRYILQPLQNRASLT